ncbi:hypothetical protein PCASD_15927 [Puccinia coronata f. sp. avenae]|uniref:Uncharacterized protein n=1 Tax=Puccinia coronata f. sp. avenae TaxID=200324 RepID=A0A2N5UEW8_9BASI|nr:hypothetical protein PCASD_15927 [Puccinia coronata f. sp. avenae]
MAARMFEILDVKNGTDAFDWQPQNMHIQCVCHKIALIVNAGLAELGIVAPPPPKVKESILGTFPYPNNMETILEEEDKEEIEDTEQPLPSVRDEDFGPEHNEEELAQLAQEEQDFINLDRLTKRLDFVVRKITSTSAWQQVFINKAKKKNSKLRSLIAGYGIRWNIKFESREHAYEAREVINEMLKEDLEKVHSQRARQQGRHSKKEMGHFQEITILSHEWQLINDLNEELKV